MGVKYRVIICSNDTVTEKLISSQYELERTVLGSLSGLTSTNVVRKLQIIIEKVNQ